MPSRDSYERVYCARGDMENRIKDQQLGLFATRTSCMRMAANQFRILLSGLAYTLFEGLRRFALGDTELAQASPDRIHLEAAAHRRRGGAQHALHPLPAEQYLSVPGPVP